MPQVLFMNVGEAAAANFLKTGIVFDRQIETGGAQHLAGRFHGARQAAGNDAVEANAMGREQMAGGARLFLARRVARVLLSAGILVLVVATLIAAAG